MRWGVAGTGVIAGAFVATIGEMGDAVVAAVGSDDPERAAAFAATHGVPASVAPHEALADLEGIDAVYVAATNDRHLGPAVACLDAGIPVLCEKPLALSRRQAELIVAAARRTSGPGGGPIRPSSSPSCLSGSRHGAFSSATSTSKRVTRCRSPTC